MTSRAVVSDESYFHILDTAPDAMIVVGPDHLIAFVNAQTERLFAYERSELVGHGLEILVPEPFRSGHEAHLSSYFTSPKVRPMGSALELFGRRKDGVAIPIEVSLSPVDAPAGPSVCAAIRDISERKNLEAANKLSADRLTNAIESIEDAFALFDAADRLVQCNSAYRRLIGETSSRPLIGMTYPEVLEAQLAIFDFGGDDERARFRAARLAERKEASGSYDMRTIDGRHLRVSNRRTTEGGIVKTAWDLTGDVAREEELREARATAEAASTAKSDFLSSISHELRTPLNAILGFAQLLQRDKREPLSSRHRGRVDHILKGGEHLLRLIDDILDLSRVEAGGTSISTEPVSVGDVLEEVSSTLELAASRAGITFEIGETPPGLPMVAADRTRFAQILMNFGSNAIKYNRPGGKVVFSISVPAPDCLRITVIDNGLGIAADWHDRIFQPFQRAGQETGSIQGTGIGLAISKRLAGLMGGRVGFRSQPSAGSEFWLEMPVHGSGARELDAKPASQRPPRSVHERKGVVLYVEDNPANVTFMEDLLSTFDGIELMSAPTAEMGIELARGRLPQLIIMDINLPGMSGIEALFELRQFPETRGIPVIALTAAASDRDRERGERAGFFRYLTKPVKVDELEEAIEALLR